MWDILHGIFVVQAVHLWTQLLPAALMPLTSPSLLNNVSVSVNYSNCISTQVILVFVQNLYILRKIYCKLTVFTRAALLGPNMHHIWFIGWDLASDLTMKA